MGARGRGRRRALAAVVTMAVSVALPGCWLQPGFDASRSRWNPVEHQITPANVGTLAEAWSVDVDAVAVDEPLVYGGRVFVGRQGTGSGGEVVALDAATGDALWRHTTTPTGDRVIAWPVAFVEGELWSSWFQGSDDPEGCRSGTTRLDGDGNVVGEDHDGIVMSGPVQSGHYVVQEETSECPTSGLWPPTTMVVRDSRTGETLWTADDRLEAIAGDLILAGGFYALAGCGAPTCTSTVHGEWASTEPYIARPHSDVFGVRSGGFGDFNGEVFALSRTTGEVVWRGSIDAPSARLAADDDHLYAAAGGRLLVFDVDGCVGPSCRPLWSAPLSGGTAEPPTVAGDVVYVATIYGAVAAFPAGGCGRTTCEEIGRLQVEGNVTAMSVAEGRLFVLSEVAPGRFRVTAFEP
jgi:outer membrane protein assembly factor BamB